MRLSEAIRIGAMLKPQSFMVGGEMAKTGTCALQAACEAVGHPVDLWGTLVTIMPILYVPVDGCPVNGCLHKKEAYPHKILQDFIWHLNDYHRWTREQIASWVELHEPDAMLPEVLEALPLPEEVMP